MTEIRDEWLERFDEWYKSLTKTVESSRKRRARYAKTISSGDSDSPSVETYAKHENASRELRHIDSTNLDLSKVEEWYTWGKFVVPTFGSREFVRFVSSGASIIAKAFFGDKKTKKRVPIRITRSVETACVSLRTADSDEETEIRQLEIMLPSWYFDESLYTPLGLASLTSAALTNGSLIHEALHIVYTKVSPDSLLFSISRDERKTFSQYGQPGFVMFNLIEDLYIEGEERLQTLGSARMFVPIKNKLLLTREKIEYVIRQMFSDTDGVIPDNFWKKDAERYSWKALLFFLSISAGFKHEGLWPFLESLLPKDLYDAVIRLGITQAKDTADKRLRDAIKLCEKFAPLPDESFLDQRTDFAIFSMAMTEKERKATSPHDRTEAMSRVMKLLKKVKSEGFGPDSTQGLSSLEGKAKEPPTDTPEWLREMHRSDSEKIAAAITRSILLPEAYSPEDLPDSLRLIERVEVLPYELWTNTYERHKTLKVRSLGYLQQLKRIRTPNHTPGRASNTGSIVSQRLWRISTDSKVCARKETFRQDQGEAEVIILIDASGSTGYSRVSIRKDDPLFDVVTHTEKTIFELELSFAIDAYKTLTAVQLPCLVAFHTSRAKSAGDQPYIGIVASSGFGNDQRLTPPVKCAIKSIHLKENYDGFAVAEVSTFFSERPRKKVLFVLSDGVPAGHGYSGEDAINHVKAVVAKLRRKGIAVFCISLVDSVVAANEKIYDRRFHIRPNNFIKDMREKVINIIKTS